MGAMQLHLYFAGASSPVLVETKFGAAAGPLHTWRGCSPQARAPHAFAALAVHSKFCRKPLDDETAVGLLRSTCHEVSKKKSDLKWPIWLLDDAALLSRLLVFDGPGKLRTVSLSRELLAPDDITVVLDGKAVATGDRRLLQRLLAGLLDRGGARTEAPRGAQPVPTSELVREMRASLNGSASGVSLFVAENEGEVPRLAATRLIDLVNTYVAGSGSDPLTICISGGNLQKFVLHELNWPAMGRTLARSVRIVALNRMRWDDWSAERSAEHLAFELARLFSSAVDVVLPPLTDHPQKLLAYRRAVRSGQILVLSAGSARASFVSEFLRQHGEALPDRAVGDLAGHPITASGENAATRKITRILAPLNCQPSLGELRLMASRGTAQVMLVADAIPGTNAPPAAKGRVVRAALLGGLVNSVVLSRRLAEEVVRGRSVSNAFRI